MKAQILATRAAERSIITRRSDLEWEAKVRGELIFSTIALLVATTTNASAFSASFQWCGGGSPVFSLSGVPNGKTSLQFHMVDLDVPSYNHGGGSVQYKVTNSGMRCAYKLHATKSPQWKPFIRVRRYAYGSTHNVPRCSKFHEKIS